MSLQVNQYWAVGVMLPGIKYNFISDENFDKAEKYMDSAYEGPIHYNGLCIIMDGLDGDYTFIGRVIEKSENHSMLDGPYSADTHVDTETIQMVKELIEAQFGIENPDVKPIFFTHYR